MERFFSLPSVSAHFELNHPNKMRAKAKETDRKKRLNWKINWTLTTHKINHIGKLMFDFDSFQFFFSCFFCGNFFFAPLDWSSQFEIVTPLRLSVFHFGFFWFCSPQVTLLTLSHMELGFRETYFTEKIRSRDKIIASYLMWTANLEWK